MSSHWGGWSDLWETFSTAAFLRLFLRLWKFPWLLRFSPHLNETARCDCWWICSSSLSFFVVHQLYWINLDTTTNPNFADVKHVSHYQSRGLFYCAVRLALQYTGGLYRLTDSNNQCRPLDDKAFRPTDQNTLNVNSWIQHDKYKLYFWIIDFTCQYLYLSFPDYVVQGIE